VSVQREGARAVVHHLGEEKSRDAAPLPLPWRVIVQSAGSFCSRPAR
jgi:hypothetical protein